jgi:hypothetical protein
MQSLVGPILAKGARGKTDPSKTLSQAVRSCCGNTLTAFVRQFGSGSRSKDREAAVPPCGSESNVGPRVRLVRPRKV